MRRGLGEATWTRLGAVALVSVGLACGGTPPGEDPLLVTGAPELRVAPDPGTLAGPGFYFGRTLALSGDLLAVSAYQQADSAVYLYQRRSGAWHELQVIQGANYYFGRSLALEGGVLVIGDPGLGRATVHRFDGVAFRQEATLEVAGGADTEFGHAVALGGETLFVAEPGGWEGGVVHLFAEQAGPGTWSPAGVLTPAGRAEWDQFGFALAASGRILVVSALTSSPPSTIVFRLGDAGWVEEASLPDPEEDEYYTFGQKVAVAGGVMVVNCACHDGEAYVYERSWNGWTLAAVLRGSTAVSGYFADGVATDGLRVVTTAPGEASGGVPGAGSATVFERGRAGWSAVARLEEPVPAADAWFGHAVAIEDGLVVVGAPGTMETGGEVYTFQLKGRGAGGRPRR